MSKYEKAREQVKKLLTSNNFPADVGIWSEFLKIIDGLEHISEPPDFIEKHYQSIIQWYDNLHKDNSYEAMASETLSYVLSCLRDIAENCGTGWLPFDPNNIPEVKEGWCLLISNKLWMHCYNTSESDNEVVWIDNECRELNLHKVNYVNHTYKLVPLS